MSRARALRSCIFASFCFSLWAAHAMPLFAASKKGGEPVLSCATTRARTQQFLDTHYLFRTFDAELSKRTFKKIFEGFDPGKYFFTATDVAGFQNVENSIHEKIGRADCNFLFEIQKLYLQRFAERQKVVTTLLSHPFTFDTDEEIVVDRTRIGWAKDTAELDERWRKRIKFQVLSMKEGISEPQAREKLKKRYDQIEKKHELQGTDDLFNLFLNSFALALDPHSSFFLPDDQEDFNIRLSSSLEGIGATLREENGYISVEALVPGGAAHRDGRLKAGDKIIAVDPGDGTGFNDVIDMELSKAVRLIRGKKGTQVKLIVLRKSDRGESERITFEITRDVVKLTDKEAKSDVMDIQGKKIGVIRLPSFYNDPQCRQRSKNECQGAAGHTQREVKKLKALGVDGIILDLRYNGGGDLQESIRLAGLFIPDGTVVQTVDRRRYTRLFQDNDPMLVWSGPMAVLINRQSASASEIVAGAIQDYSRGLIIGDSHTYGKGTVQVVQEIPGTAGRRSDGAIKVTNAKFYRPSGRSNQEKGIESDVVIPDVLDFEDIGEKENDFVLPWDSIRAAADFKPVGQLSTIVPQLAKLSGERIAKDKGFVELKEKIEKFKKEKGKGTASLKDAVAIKKEKPVAKAAQTKGKQKDKEEADAREERDPNVVIHKNDIWLKESANILADAIVAGKEKSWVNGR